METNYRLFSKSINIDETNGHIPLGITIIYQGRKPNFLELEIVEEGVAPQGFEMIQMRSNTKSKSELMKLKDEIDELNKLSEIKELRAKGKDKLLVDFFEEYVLLDKEHKSLLKDKFRAKIITFG